MNKDDINYYWKSVVDTIQDGVMIVSPVGTIVSVNRAFEHITGYSRREIVGKSCTTLACTSCEIARRQESCYWCVMFKKGNLRQQKCRISHKNGKTVDILKHYKMWKK